MKHILRLLLASFVVSILTACNPGLTVRQNQFQQNQHYQQPARYYQQPAYNNNWGYITGEPLLNNYGYGHGHSYGHGGYGYYGHPTHESISVY